LATWLLGKTPIAISWAGYAPDENSWEPVENSRNTSSAGEEFHIPLMVICQPVTST